MIASSRWLSRLAAEVPPGEDWLGPRERSVVASLRVEHRRRDWRLGRWTAKSLAADVLGAAVEQIEVLAAEDGAPEAWLADERLPLSLSLSHRAGRALAVVSESGAIGCDLELVEARSPAFVRQWLAPAEQRLLAGATWSQRPLLANLIWCGKEAAAKVRREGLRLEVSRAVVELHQDRAAAPPWRALRVGWPDGRVTDGWWAAARSWVVVVAAEPAAPAPAPAPVGGGGLIPADGTRRRAQPPFFA